MRPLVQSAKMKNDLCVSVTVYLEHVMQPSRMVSNVGLSHKWSACSYFRNEKLNIGTGFFIHACNQ